MHVYKSGHDVFTAEVDLGIPGSAAAGGQNIGYLVLVHQDTIPFAHLHIAAAVEYFSVFKHVSHINMTSVFKAKRTETVSFRSIFNYTPKPRQCQYYFRHLRITATVQGMVPSHCVYVTSVYPARAKKALYVSGVNSVLKSAPAFPIASDTRLAVPFFVRFM